MSVAAYILAIFLAYLIGSIPFGFIAGKLKGVDVRAAGSGNIGATNAFRVLGKTAGICVLVADMLKGFVAARGVPWVVARLLSVENSQNLALAAGVGAVLGHIFTFWLKFKGGKGIATTAGVCLAWAPQGCAVALASWGITFLLTRYVSLASLVAAVVLPIAVWYFGGSLNMTIIVSCISLLAIYKHKANIRRLMEGTENRAGKPRPSPPPP